MFVARYDPVGDRDKVTDEILPALVRRLRDSASKNNDDVMIMAFGLTGSGKSTLMLHGYEAYTPYPSVEHIALNPTDFARVLNKLGERPVDRFAGFDEADVSRRAWMTSFNQDVIGVYFAIRGLGGFHWWNNPSIDYLDKQLVAERIKFVFFCWDKAGSPRRYWCFSRQRFLALINKYGDAKVETVRKHGARFAEYEGWFKPYRGALLRAYEELKDSRMEERLVDFAEKYGAGRTHSVVQAAALVGVSDHTLKKALLQGAAEGRFVRAKHYVTKGSRYLLTEEGVEALKAELATAGRGY